MDQAAARLPPGQARPGLQDLRQFGSECAAGRLLAIPSAALLAVGTLSVRLALGAAAGLLLRRRRSAGSILAFRRLRGIGAQQAIFEGCAVEAANDRLHLIAGGRFDKSEALGFLRFVVSDHFDGIGDEVFGGQPLLDVVCGDPGREVAKKNGKAHSVDFVTPLWICGTSRGGFRSATLIVSEWLSGLQTADFSEAIGSASGT